MKKEVTIYVCDRCGSEYNGHQNGWYEGSDGEYVFIGVKVIRGGSLFSNCGVGSEYDLCPKCTAEIVEQWLKKMKENEK